MPKGKKRDSYVISNQDRLLMEVTPGIIGGKTGLTPRTPVARSSALRTAMDTLIISILQTDLHLDDAGAKLLDWGLQTSARWPRSAPFPSQASGSRTRPTSLPRRPPWHNQRLNPQHSPPPLPQAILQRPPHPDPTATPSLLPQL